MVVALHRALHAPVEMLGKRVGHSLSILLLLYLLLQQLLLLHLLHCDQQRVDLLVAAIDAITVQELLLGYRNVVPTARCDG